MEKFNVYAARLLPKEDFVAAGHRACQGCGEALGARYAIDAAMRATDKQLIAANATGCLEVFSTPYPETSWQIPWIHSLFGNTAAVATGIEEHNRYGLDFIEAVTAIKRELPGAMVSGGVSVRMLPIVTLKLNPASSAAYITASAASTARVRVRRARFCVCRHAFHFVQQRLHLVVQDQQLREASFQIQEPAPGDGGDPLVHEAGRVDELPGALTGRVLEGRAAGALAGRLMGLAVFGDGGHLGLDLVVLDDAPSNGVDQEHPSGLQPPLAHHGGRAVHGRALR